MGLFNWLRKLFGKEEAKPAASAEQVQLQILQQLQGLVQSLGTACWYYSRNYQKVGLGQKLLAELRQLGGHGTKTK